MLQGSRFCVTIKPMVIVLVLKWWYGAGWQWAWKRSVNGRIQWLSEAFSIPALIRTWFSPFKQTYSKVNKGSIDLKVQAAVDNFVSRMIGSLLRTIIIVVGLVGIVLVFVIGIITVIIWPLIPLLTLLAVALSLGVSSV